MSSLDKMVMVVDRPTVYYFAGWLSAKVGGQNIGFHGKVIFYLQFLSHACCRWF